MSLVNTPVSTELTHRQIPHRLFTHAGDVQSLEQAARERGQSPDQVVRSILFRLGEQEFAMVLIAGAGQLSWKALRRHFAQSRMSMANAEEVERVTGALIGAVSPFALPQRLPILIDRSITLQEEVSIGSGVRGTTVLIHVADLLRALPEAVIGDFAEHRLNHS